MQLETLFFEKKKEKGNFPVEFQNTINTRIAILKQNGHILRHIDVYSVKATGRNFRKWRYYKSGTLDLNLYSYPKVSLHEFSVYWINIKGNAITVE